MRILTKFAVVLLASAALGACTADVDDYADEEDMGELDENGEFDESGDFLEDPSFEADVELVEAPEEVTTLGALETLKRYCNSAARSAATWPTSASPSTA